MNASLDPSILRFLPLLVVETRDARWPVDNTAFLPILLPELSASGWFSVGLGGPKVV